MQQKGLEFGDAPRRSAEPAPRTERAPTASAHRAEPRPRTEPAAAPRRAWTVSQLTARLQGVLETEFFDVWVEGEISNLKLAGSGHWYFSLKDSNAQIRAVIWKAAARLVRFKPKDGLKVVARGSLRVYPPRGEYQLSVEVLEPLGKGSLQQAFEELKEKLEKEGLFDPGRKRPLPMLPRCVGVVTSPGGAVIRDILRVLGRRYHNLEVLLYPARVQGEGAAAEIVQGIRALNQVPGLDVLIVARGGGSLEDLWPFNEETVARALAASRVPTISAVGHETDFTIADFVADLRVPTPSAAAERVVQAKQELASRLEHLAARGSAAMAHRLTRVRARVAALTSHRVFAAEQGRLRNHAQRVDELALRAERGLRRRAERAAARASALGQRLDAFRIDRLLASRRERLGRHAERLLDLARAGLARRRAGLGTAAGKLESLSPLGVLSRGYALVWAEHTGRLLRSAAEVGPGDPLRVRVREGQLRATVTGREPAP
jgi:exodeoxyribonuclease VII large subunit